MTTRVKTDREVHEALANTRGVSKRLSRDSIQSGNDLIDSVGAVTGPAMRYALPYAPLISALLRRFAAKPREEPQRLAEEAVAPRHLAKAVL